MEAKSNSAPHRLPGAFGLKSTEYWINEAINAKHAIEATARALAELVNSHGSYQEIGIHEALLLSVSALGNALMEVADSTLPEAPVESQH